MVEQDLTFGRWLKLQRQLLHLTQKELAVLASCSLSTLRKIEADERRPSETLAASLSTALKIDAAELEAFITFARSEPYLEPVPVPTLPADTAPWLALHKNWHNLPASMTPLLGRAHDEAAVRNALTQPQIRLLTLIGPPGVGKTRLAIEVAATLQDSFADGVRFIELAFVDDPDLVVVTTAQTVGIKEAGNQPLLSRLKEFLRHKQMLLVLDNFEHLLDAGPTVTEILRSCPEIKALTTSRTVLGLQGEHRYALSPLLLPNLNEPATPESLAGFPSVALFTERARAVNPTFELTAENAQTVATICARLDGLPLAIELAAAWTSFLTSTELLNQLDNSLDLLQGGALDLSPRQRTLRAAVQWSYELLSPKEQALLTGLSLFGGGCTLAAAEVMLAAMPLKASSSEDSGVMLQKGDVLTGLASLLNKSLILREAKPDSQTRYRMLETIRQYAGERLAAAKNGDALRQQHAAYFLDWAETAEPELRGPNQQVFLQRFQVEYDNLRLTLRWSLEQQDIETALRLGGALWRFWALSSQLTEGRKWLSEALAHNPGIGSTDTRPPSFLAAQAKALNGAGYLAHAQGDAAAAKNLCERSLTLWQALGTAGESGRASTLHNLGLVAQDQGDYDAAIERHQACLDISQRIGDQVGVYISLYNLAEMAMANGDFERAETLHNESLKLKQVNKDTWSITFSLTSLARLALKQHDHTRAKSLYRESLKLRKSLGYTQGIAASLVGLAGLANMMGQSQQAVRLFGAADKLLDTTGASLSPQTREYYEQHLTDLRGRQDKRTFARLWEEGQSLSLDQVIREALVS